MTALRALVESACAGLGSEVDAGPILAETRRNLYDGVPIDEVHKAAILAARTLIEKDPAYTRATARLLLHTIRKEVLGEEVGPAEMGQRYPEYFPQFIRRGIAAELLDERLGQYDLARLGEALRPERDLQFDYLGLQTLYDRYFLHVDERRIELPQAFFMRVAMGLALGEIDREARAIEFYDVLSSFDFMSSTPTLFNSGTRRSQLSSCYLTTVADDLDGIYEALKENALLSKFAGGLGNDWTRVRALGSYIKGTNGKSQGVVPFLKVVNDTAVAVNQGGKRKGAVCAYLESWHLDIEEFLDLRKNTGDDRRRTHDMNTANWIPDLFMKRVLEGGDWTLFSPSTCPDLHDKFGKAFEEAYVAYEARVDRGEIKLFKRMPAKDLWRKMLSMLFETGHPWITFKDACNVRSPQQHVGVVHSSNLCTEITLNTSDTEIAVCNLGSVNLVQHLVDGPDGRKVIDQAKLKNTVRRRATATGAIARWDWASWASRTACTSCVCPTPAPKPWPLPTAAWKRCATTPTGPAPSWPRSGAATPATAAACGTGASCRRTRSTCWPASAAARPGGLTCRSTAPARWTGTRCAPASASTACATATAWRSRRPPRSATSSASTRRSSPASATCRSRATCRASSPSSTSTWCAT